MDVERLQRENEALRRLLVRDGECEHAWNIVTYDHKEHPTCLEWKWEWECMKCLRRKPPETVKGSLP